MNTRTKRPWLVLLGLVIAGGLALTIVPAAYAQSVNRCTACNGTGTIISPYIGGFGLDTPEPRYCGICKITREAHSHKVCWTCRGSGHW